MAVSFCLFFVLKFILFNFFTSFGFLDEYDDLGDDTWAFQDDDTGSRERNNYSFNFIILLCDTKI
jgi:hypothetical protein